MTDLDSHHDIFDPDRGGGMLSTRQREYLTGEIDFEQEYARPKEAEHILRSRMKKRIYNTLYDFVLITRRLGPHDYEWLFQELRELDDPDFLPANSALFEILIFFFLGLIESDIQIDRAIESSLLDAIAIKSLQEGVLFDGEFNMELKNGEEVDIEDAKTRLEEEGQELTDRQLFFLEMYVLDGDLPIKPP